MKQTVYLRDIQLRVVGQTLERLVKLMSGQLPREGNDVKQLQ